MKLATLKDGSRDGMLAVVSRDLKTAHVADGNSCIAEQRCLETIEFGEPATPFMRFGDTIRIEMLDEKGKSIFGAIEQTVKRLER